MRIVAVTACPTGIAHTYMAADALIKTAPKFNVSIKVETQGAMGIENLLTDHDIVQADKILIVSDIDIEQPNRFDPAKTVLISMEEVLLSVEKVFIKHCRDLKPCRDTKPCRS
ncbi:MULTISPECIES: PTS fructose transporter subunit IIB [Vibrio]|jgi:PTS system fructose-specific IIB component|uniref:protein-N(pi)-phosphohistidine--D-fructose phosphotransferase n=2 Tax=Vibrio TaxID=662 RepID=A0A2N7JSZ9_VIBSP|nr:MULTISPECIES: PTS fructose transporter subunit IIB [Vibrio]TVU64992.1 PTS fructose transporter subunit IIB [Vibrio atlanticus]KPL96654.1 PTS fructose transporter subunit IIB [Vibrio splendidus]MCF7494639.1 PTS fructose transporter subunit IIB [Vibrio sp. L5-1]NOI89447.1 PTS fructose transporter subunit IIB [Vibrio splendidus]NOJ04309.1 PTS fructose transporter subunit IIB [Vibrio splendidus]